VNPDHAWIIGGGGALGSGIRRQFAVEFPETTLRAPLSTPIPWNDPPRRDARLAEELRSWSVQVRASGAPWICLWCAGSGVVSTSLSALEAETAAFGSFLEALGRELADAAPGQRGLFLLASSAGGTYAGSPGSIFTEDVPCRPLSPYGHAKLQQEEMLRSWLRERPAMSGLVARYSNLYGPGQKLDKPQGFISQLARSILWRRALSVYVPMDTIRDYLFISDAASVTLCCLKRLMQEGPGTLVTKILASGRSASLAEIIGILGKIAPHHPRIIVGRTGSRQPSKLKFRSTVYPEIQASSPTPLPAGIRAVFLDLVSLLQQGRLPPPVELPSRP
jgi:UDP-glucose 4-epimerase